MSYFIPVLKKDLVDERHIVVDEIAKSLPLRKEKGNYYFRYEDIVSTTASIAEWSEVTLSWQQNIILRCEAQSTGDAKLCFDYAFTRPDSLYFKNACYVFKCFNDDQQVLMFKIHPNSDMFISGANYGSYKILIAKPLTGNVRVEISTTTSLAPALTLNNLRFENVSEVGYQTDYTWTSPILESNNSTGIKMYWVETKPKKTNIVISIKTFKNNIAIEKKTIKNQEMTMFSKAFDSFCYEINLTTTDNAITPQVQVLNILTVNNLETELAESFTSRKVISDKYVNETIRNIKSLLEQYPLEGMELPNVLKIIKVGTYNQLIHLVKSISEYYKIPNTLVFLSQGEVVTFEHLKNINDQIEIIFKEVPIEEDSSALIVKKFTQDPGTENKYIEGTKVIQCDGIDQVEGCATSSVCFAGNYMAHVLHDPDEGDSVQIFKRTNDNFLKTDEFSTGGASIWALEWTDENNLYYIVNGILFECLITDGVVNSREIIELDSPIMQFKISPNKNWMVTIEAWFWKNIALPTKPILTLWNKVSGNWVSKKKETINFNRSHLVPAEWSPDSKFLYVGAPQEKSLYTYTINGDLVTKVTTANLVSGKEVTNIAIAKQNRIFILYEDTLCFCRRDLLTGKITLFRTLATIKENVCQQGYTYAEYYKIAYENYDYFRENKTNWPYFFHTKTRLQLSSDENWLAFSINSHEGNRFIFWVVNYAPAKKNTNILETKWSPEEVYDFAFDPSNNFIAVGSTKGKTKAYRFGSIHKEDGMVYIEDLGEQWGLEWKIPYKETLHEDLKFNNSDLISYYELYLLNDSGWVLIKVHDIKSGTLFSKSIDLVPCTHFKIVAYDRRGSQKEITGELMVENHDVVDRAELYYFNADDIWIKDADINGNSIVTPKRQLKANTIYVSKYKLLLYRADDSLISEVQFEVN